MLPKTQDKHQILGKITNEHAPVGDAALGVPSHAALGTSSVNSHISQIQLSEIGEIVRTFIENIPNTNLGVFVPKYVIMPNHIHLILVVELENTNGTPGNMNGTPRAASPTKALIPKIINSLKGLSSKKIKFPLWQRSFHDHVIRNEADYNRIAEYIENNPANWEKDCFFENDSNQYIEERVLRQALS